MREAKNFLDSENRRCDNYLGESFRKELVEVFREHMLVEPMEKLLQKETALMYIFKNQQIEELKLTF